MPRCLLLSLNPGYDRWLEIRTPSAFERIYRADAVRVVASGKGVNVARCFERMGFDDYAGLMIIGGATGRQLLHATQLEGLKLSPFEIAGDTRVNVTALLTYQQDTLTLNEPGPQMQPEEVEGFLRCYADMLSHYPGAWMVISGSAPRGFDTAAYLRLLSLARDGGHPLTVDISGPWLKASVEGPLETLKINREEFTAAFAFDPFEDWPRTRDFARRHAIHTLILTDGARGSVALDASGEALRARFLPEGMGAYAVGSGDSYMAGYLMARFAGEGLSGAIAQATAFGMANAYQLEPALIHPDSVARAASFVRVEPLEA